MCNESMMGLLNSSWFISNTPGYSGMWDKVSCLGGIRLFSKNMYPDETFSDSEPNISTHLSPFRQFLWSIHSFLFAVTELFYFPSAEPRHYAVPCVQRLKPWRLFLSSLCRNLIFMKLPDHLNKIVNGSLLWAHSQLLPSLSFFCSKSSLNIPCNLFTSMHNY